MYKIRIGVRPELQSRRLLCVCVLIWRCERGAKRHKIICSLLLNRKFVFFRVGVSTAAATPAKLGSLVGLAFDQSGRGRLCKTQSQPFQFEKVAASLMTFWKGCKILFKFIDCSFERLISQILLLFLDFFKCLLASSRSVFFLVVKFDLQQ